MDNHLSQPPSDRLAVSLQNRAIFDHPVKDFSIIETHISWILLTGHYAYKIKKTVDFGFVDFSTLEKRKFYCREELRLNRRYAPDLYIDLVPIYGSIDSPYLTGNGEPIEYAIKMKQFSQDALLSQLATQHTFCAEHIDKMATAIATNHQQAESADLSTPYGSPTYIHQWITGNFDHIRPLLHDKILLQRLDTLSTWSEREYNHRTSLFSAWKEHGLIKECHGDLHLANMLLLDDQIIPFDCIEFNPGLRWIDVISEVSFVVMDLHHHGYPALAQRFLNRYLQQTGDYTGVRLVRYYLVYRALVRAKVALLHLSQQGAAKEAQTKNKTEYQNYAALAQKFTREKNPMLIITHGVSGSGKSVLSEQLVEIMEAIQVRSDIERKRLFGYTANDATHSAIRSSIYTTEATQQTYNHLMEAASHIIDAGFSAIVDATFLQHQQRESFYQLAERLHAPFLILDVYAPQEVLSKRISHRQQQRNDPSEATEEVLMFQTQQQDDLTSKERLHTLTIDTSKLLPINELGHMILERCAKTGVTSTEHA